MRKRAWCRAPAWELGRRVRGGAEVAPAPQDEAATKMDPGLIQEYFCAWKTSVVTCNP